MTIEYLPTKLPSIMDRIKEGVFLPQFFQLIHTSGYHEIFPEMVQITLFIPTEDTLEYLTPEQIKVLNEALDNEHKAKKIIENHIIKEELSLVDLSKLEEVFTINNREVSIDIHCNILDIYEAPISESSSLTAKINGFDIETANLVCYNGIMHSIKGVIL
jgi:uncharacterized surface protein with fasciclin (FAS1) repeats